MRTRTLTVALAAAALLAVPAARAQTIFSGGGNAAATTALNDFQTAIGGANNGGASGTQPDGFRRINWDGVPIPAAGSDTDIDGNTIGMAPNRFAGRGSLFSEVIAISDNGFATVNPDTAGEFPAFTPAKTFAPFNSNVIDMTFTVPGSLTTAASRGFGAIFLDVELANTSSIEYFSNGVSLGSFAVPVTPVNAEASFLGVLFDDPVVTDVRLTLGNGTLFSFDGNTVTPGGPEGNGIDRVVTDDFVYAEPTFNIAAAPEPGTVALLGIGVAMLAISLLLRHLSQIP